MKPAAARSRPHRCRRTLERVNEVSREAAPGSITVSKRQPANLTALSAEQFGTVDRSRTDGIDARRRHHPVERSRGTCRVAYRQRL
jgi:hypothetical protein